LKRLKKKRGSKTRPGSSNHEQQKRLKAASNIPHESWFCEMCEEVSEENMIQCVSCRRWGGSRKLCGGETSKKKGFSVSAANQVI
jgi:hypothetical protein